MELKIKEQLISLFEDHFKEEVIAFEKLPGSGSYREYCRLKSDNHQAIGTFNADLKENRAFLYFSTHFKSKGLPVPEIYVVDRDELCYLQEDLGGTMLFDFVAKYRQLEDFSERIINQYKKVLSILPQFQIYGGKELDYNYCYPRAAFDKQSMMWDLSYFKYYFLKLTKIPFDEQLLEDDYQKLTDYLLSSDTDYFLYRDFQSRNIMVNNDTVYFIDYQGGRKGALQYDLASLLYDSKADIPQHVRNELLEFYLDELEKHIEVDREEFKRYYIGYALIRILQAMGAFGFRGFYEKKEHFLKSIPYALNDLETLIEENTFDIEMPELISVLKKVCKSEFLRTIAAEEGKLNIRISSFSYRKGIPEDPSGNGGGFVFDCRLLHNPGRYEEHKHLSGKDNQVKEFLENNSNVGDFLEPIYKITEQAVKKYLVRGYSNLSINFGCTGGQHRSVYCAEKLAEYLKNNFPVELVLQHREQDFWE